MVYNSYDNPILGFEVWEDWDNDNDDGYDNYNDGPIMFDYDEEGYHAAYSWVHTE